MVYIYTGGVHRRQAEGNVNTGMWCAETESPVWSPSKTMSVRGRVVVVVRGRGMGREECQPPPPPPPPQGKSVQW